MKNVKKVKLILIMFVMIFMFIGNAFAYKELLIENRGGKPIRVIKVVLDGQDFVITSLAGNGGDTLENLIKKVGGDSGINGTFFCPADYSYCGGITHSNFERIFLGDGASYSTDWPNTSVRIIFGFDAEGKPLMVQNKTKDGDDGLRTDINKNRLNDLEFGLSNYTVLLVEGDNVVDINVNPARDWYSSSMMGSANRNFICSTRDGSTIYMGVVGGISIPKLAEYVKNNFGCYNALALDAGASEAMVYEGNVLARSSRRKIMDAFVVVDRETYIKLTGYTPIKNTTYTPENQYELTDEDIQTVDLLESLFVKLVKQNGANFKNTEKKILRDLISSEQMKYNFKQRAVFHELLIRLFTIDKI